MVWTKLELRPYGLIKPSQIVPMVEAIYEDCIKTIETTMRFYP